MQLVCVEVRVIWTTVTFHFNRVRIATNGDLEVSTQREAPHHLTPGIFVLGKVQQKSAHGKKTSRQERQLTLVDKDASSVFLFACHACERGYITFLWGFHPAKFQPSSLFDSSLLCFSTFGIQRFHPPYFRQRHLLPKCSFRIYVQTSSESRVEKVAHLPSIV